MIEFESETEDGEVSKGLSTKLFGRESEGVGCIRRSSSESLPDDSRRKQEKEFSAETTHVCTVNVESDETEKRADWEDA